MSLTKSNFMNGIQCKKMLWLSKHKPKEKVIPPYTQKLLNKGNDFGDSLMGIFGEYVEVREYIPGTTIPNKKKMAEKTQELIDKGTPIICEAAFRLDDAYCAVDILRKVEDAYWLYEVKNARHIKEQHIKDAAFQTYLIRKSGLNLTKVHIIYQGNPYTIQDVTEQVEEKQQWVADNLPELLEVIKAKEEPECEMGTHCNSPYGCWWKEYCKSRINA